VFLVALKLGITSFGGPVAHLGYFRREYVERRRWMDDQTYADIVALFQFVPGPASSETGIAIGLLRAGPLGAFAAWLGFTLPSAILMTAFAVLLERLPPERSVVTRALQLLALVIVSVAVYRMARALAWDLRRGAIALAAAAAALRFASVDAFAQVWIILIAGVAGHVLLAAPAIADRPRAAVPISRRVAVFCAAAYVALLVLLPIARLTTLNGEVALFDSFYRSGALVFGGGHVVLPLLHAEVVPPGWVTDEEFLAGYGAAQAVPGPLFTFAAYLGARIAPYPGADDPAPSLGGDLFGPWPPNGIAGAAIATIAIFLPAFLLVFAALPSWGALRTRSWAQRALRGVNASVVGLLLAALITLARSVIASLL